jgi:hypothetical protein
VGSAHAKEIVMVSDWKRAANRRNALKSTGPKSAEGIARATGNGTTHGIFCRSLVLAGECNDEFILFREQIVQSLSPQDLTELGLVDQIVSAYWRLRRVQAAEQFLHEARAEQIEEDAEKESHRLAKVLLSDEDDDEETDEQTIRRRQEYLAAIQAGEITAAATLAIVCGDDDPSFDRLSRYEQRLTGQIHRSLRDLEKLRQPKRRKLKLKLSPFSAEALAVLEDASESAAKTHIKNATRSHGTVGDLPSRII